MIRVPARQRSGAPLAAQQRPVGAVRVLEHISSRLEPSPLEDEEHPPVRWNRSLEHGPQLPGPVGAELVSELGARAHDMFEDGTREKPGGALADRVR